MSSKLHIHWTEKRWQAVTLVFSTSFHNLLINLFFIKKNLYLDIRGCGLTSGLWGGVNWLSITFFLSLVWRWAFLQYACFLLFPLLLKSFTAFTFPRCLFSCHVSLCFCKYAALFSGSALRRALYWRCFSAADKRLIFLKQLVNT